MYKVGFSTERVLCAIGSFVWPWAAVLSFQGGALFQGFMLTGFALVSWIFAIGWIRELAIRNLGLLEWPKL